MSVDSVRDGVMNIGKYVRFLMKTSTQRYTIRITMLLVVVLGEAA